MEGPTTNLDHNLGNTMQAVPIFRAEFHAISHLQLQLLTALLNAQQRHHL